MKCAQCGAETAVLETRKTGPAVRRRRLCIECGVKCTTAEIVVPDDRSFINAVVVFAVDAARARSLRAALNRLDLLLGGEQ